jgi:hypothetical protein
MRRRTFDLMVSWGGLILAAVFAISGILLLTGYHYANSNVHDQLAAQQIFFPPGGSDALKEKGVAPYLDKYAGQQLVNGQQAEVYADHFIAVHLEGVAGGKTYAQVSSAALADPTNEELQGQAATLFKGETLRGLLLNAYAFWKMGQIAFLAAMGAFAAAGVFLILAVLGFWHLRRVPVDQEIGVPHKDTKLGAVASYPEI